MGNQLELRIKALAEAIAQDVKRHDDTLANMVVASNLPYFSASKNGTQSLNTSNYEDIVSFTETNSDSPFSFNTTTGELTFLEDGLYQIIVGVEIVDTGTSNRVQLQLAILENTGGGYLSNSELEWMNYAIRDANQNNGGVNGVYVKLYQNGDKIKLQSKGVVDGGSYNIKDKGARIYIAKLQGLKGDKGDASGPLTTSTVGVNELKNELKAVVDLLGTDVDWSNGIQFTKTLTSNTTLTFSNVVVGKTITLVISGNYSLSLPNGIDVNDLSDYDGTKTNVIHITCIDISTPLYSATLKVY